MTEDTASALGVRSRLGFGEVPQRAHRHPCPFLLDRRIAASAPACARLELVYALPREPRIRAHVLLCWLAPLLIRVAERRTGHRDWSPNRMHRMLRSRCLVIAPGRSSPDR